MRLLKTRRSKVVTALLCGAALGLGGVATAYWTADGGAGSGTASAADGGQNLGLTSAPITGLVPGGPAALVHGTISNPNPYTVALGNRVVRVTGLTVDSQHSGCAVSNFAIVPNPSYYNDYDAPLTANHSMEYYSPDAIQLKETNTNQDDCKGATVTLTLALQ